MICPPCREAGHLNADANRVHDTESAEYLRTRAQEKHGECHGDCGCQHHAGQFTRKEAR